MYSWGGRNSDAYWPLYDTRNANKISPQTQIKQFDMKRFIHLFLDQILFTTILELFIEIIKARKEQSPEWDRINPKTNRTNPPWIRPITRVDMTRKKGEEETEQNQSS